MAEIAKLLMNCGIMLSNHSLSFFFCQSGQNHFLLLFCSYFFFKKENIQGDIHSILN